jgi:hypothetical protein
MGLETSRLFSSNGWFIVAVDNNIETTTDINTQRPRPGLKELEAELGGASNVHIAKVDVSKKDEFDALIEELEKKLPDGKLDIVFANAGIGTFGGSGGGVLGLGSGLILVSSSRPRRSLVLPTFPRTPGRSQREFPRCYGCHLLFFEADEEESGVAGILDELEFGNVWDAWDCYVFGNQARRQRCVESTFAPSGNRRCQTNAFVDPSHPPIQA